METKSLKIFDSGERSILNKRIVSSDKYSEKTLDVVTYSVFNLNISTENSTTRWFFLLFDFLSYNIKYA